MTCCQVVALLLLSFLPSAAAGDLVPTLVPRSALQLAKGWFLSQPILEMTTHCDDACAHWEATLVPQDFQEYLSYETVYPNGTRTLTTVEVSPWVNGAERRQQRWHVRGKRQIYSADRRFSIIGNHFLMNYPFSATVKISTGCTGVLVSTWHVLTAAHCIHNNKDYVKGAKKIRVGFLTPAQGAGNGMGTERLTMRWAQMQRTQVPTGWIWGPKLVSMDNDYALLELHGPHRRPHMKLMAAPAAEEVAGKRIHFLGFDSDWPGDCYCGVEDKTVHLIYQHCDARPGVSSSEVYGKVWDPV